MLAPLRILGDKGSGNCLKVLWTAQLLQIPFEWEDVDVTSDRSDARRTRSAEFLAMNPFGEIPVVILPDGRTLAQSNAIMRFLARGTSLLPDDPYQQAKVDEWLFWEQYSHEPYLAVCRSQMRFVGKRADEREAWRVARGEAALDLLERTLVSKTYLVNNTLTLADIALVAYTRWAHEGGFDLVSRPHLRGWIGRCEAALGISQHQSAA